MAKVLTSDRLIRSVKRRGMLPTDINTFSKEDFLDMMNEELSNNLVANLLEVHEQYLLYCLDIPVGKERENVNFRGFITLKDIPTNEDYIKINTSSNSYIYYFDRTGSVNPPTSTTEIVVRVDISGLLDLSSVLNALFVVLQTNTEFSSTIRTDELEIKITMNDKMNNLLIDSGNASTIVSTVNNDIEKLELSFDIPYRAIGNKLKDVALVDSCGDHYELTRIDIGDLADYNVTYGNYNNMGSFFVKNDKIHLVSTTVESYEFLRMYYYLSPNTLVADADGAIITSIDRETGVLGIRTPVENCNDFPERYNADLLYDFILGRNPSSIIAYDIPALATDNFNNTITFDPNVIPKDLKVGDYLNIQCETIVPQLPKELHPLLAQYTVIHALEAIGDNENLSAAYKKLKDLKRNIGKLIDNRVENAPQKVKPRHTTLKGNYASNWRRS